MTFDRRAVVLALLLGVCGVAPCFAQNATTTTRPVLTSPEMEDELIQNRDRNAGNFIWTKDWTMWMVDHTRAFRLGKDLLQPQLLERCERTLFESMRALTAPALTETMGKSLAKQEIDALIARRDVIVKLFDDKIAQRSEAAVLYTLAR